MYYICNGDVEDDNYQWLYVNYQFGGSLMTKQQTNEISVISEIGISEMLNLQ